MMELLFIEGGKGGETIRLAFDKAWFGRQATCDVVLPDEELNPVHCLIERRGDDYFIVDNKSSTGTFVNRERISESVIRVGDQITIGPNQILIRQAGTMTPFRFLIDRDNGESQIIDQTSIDIGRKNSCSLQLDDLAVSPVHAGLEFRDGRIHVSDRSNGAGVYVNGQRVISQELQDGDVVRIKPFDVTVTIFEGKCVLGVRHLNAVPEAKPSVGIAAPAQWVQAKAPVWVPTSDLSAGRFPKMPVAVALASTLALAAYIWGSQQIWISPGEISPAHSNLSCSSCHSSAGSEREAKCQSCHASVKPATHAAAAAHTRQRIDCASCHPEHQGSTTDLVRSVAGGCQSAGCHSQVHAKEKRSLAARRIPSPQTRILGADAFNARLVSFTGKPGDLLHRKHMDMLGQDCMACHTDQKGLVKVETSVMRSRCLVCHYASIQKAPIPGGSPLEASFANFKTHPDDPMHARHSSALSGECGNCHADGNTTVRVSRETMRARCLSCHGFGEEATLEQRCHRCHFQHSESDPEKIRALLNPKPPVEVASSWPNFPLWLKWPGFFVVPALYLAFVAKRWRRDQQRRLREIQHEVDQVEKFPTEVKITEVHSPANAAPVAAIESAHQRPSIDLDLCLGCGICVTACPFEVLEIVNEKAIAARMDDCTGFAACAAECPTDAIQLVMVGPLQVQSLPVMDASLQSNVPGLYLAGEVTGKGLIKAAINQGKLVADSIIANPPAAGVIGSGPAGISAALAVKQAGLSVKVLEQGTLANTIRNYPRQKFVMAEPVYVPLFGPLWIEDSSKETLLDRWREIVASTGLTIEEGVKVAGIESIDGAFNVKAEGGLIYQAGSVVLAVGRRGSPRRLEIAGEELAKVAYSLLDADAYQGRAICVVGGGDSAIETVIALSRAELSNTISLVHRGKSFDKSNPRNLKKLMKRIDEGRVTPYLESKLVEIHECSVLVHGLDTSREIDNDFVFVLAGGLGPQELLAACGVETRRSGLG